MGFAFWEGSIKPTLVYPLGGVGVEGAVGGIVRAFSLV